jgi:hypothetical protein
MNSPKLFRLLVLGGALIGQAGCGAPKDPGQMQMNQVTDDGGNTGGKDGGGTPVDLKGVGTGGDAGQPFW